MGRSHLATQLGSKLIFCVVGSIIFILVEYFFARGLFCMEIKTLFLGVGFISNMACRKGKALNHWGGIFARQFFARQFFARVLLLASFLLARFLLFIIYKRARLRSA